MPNPKNLENLLNKSNLVQTKYLHELELALLNLEEKYKSKNPEYFRDIIHKEAEYVFTDGIYKGRKEILKAFAETWEYIKDEIYLIKDVKWLFVSDEVGVCSYRFDWKCRRFAEIWTRQCHQCFYKKFTRCLADYS